MFEPKSFEYGLDVEAGVATITLNRPERLNALTFDVYDELRRAFYAISDEPDVRAVIITGTGRGFCTGGDVEDIIGRLFDRDMRGLLDFTRMTCDLILAMRRCRKPVIGALNGTVAGAGAVIATACDLRIGAESAKIAYLFTKVGLSGADMGASWLLPRIVGQGRAMELLMTGDFIDAVEAERIGLYNRVVPDDDLDDAVADLIARATRGSALSKSLGKRGFYAQIDLEQGKAYDYAIELMSSSAMIELAPVSNGSLIETPMLWSRPAPSMPACMIPGPAPVTTIQPAAASCSATRRVWS